MLMGEGGKIAKQHTNISQSILAAISWGCGSQKGNQSSQVSKLTEATWTDRPLKMHHCIIEHGCKPTQCMPIHINKEFLQKAKCKSP